MKQTAVFSLAIVAAIATSSLAQAGDNFILRNSERSWDRFNQQQNFDRLYEQNERALRQQRFNTAPRPADRYDYGYPSYGTRDIGNFGQPSYSRPRYTPSPSISPHEYRLRRFDLDW
jgi:hypothetical protein